MLDRQLILNWMITNIYVTYFCVWKLIQQSYLKVLISVNFDFLPLKTVIVQSLWAKNAHFPMLFTSYDLHFNKATSRFNLIWSYY